MSAERVWSLGGIEWRSPLTAGVAQRDLVDCGSRGATLGRWLPRMGEPDAGTVILGGNGRADHGVVFVGSECSR